MERTTKATIIVLSVALLGAYPTSRQFSTVVRSGKRTLVSSLEVGLPKQTVETWFTNSLPKGTTVKWKGNVCSEDAYIPHPPASFDWPICSEATAVLTDRREVFLRLRFGTAAKVAKEAKLDYLIIRGGKGKYLDKRVPRLSALPQFLTATKPD